jgi:hypothetical protein
VKILEGQFLRKKVILPLHITIFSFSFYEPVSSSNSKTYKSSAWLKDITLSPWEYLEIMIDFPFMRFLLSFLGCINEKDTNDIRILLNIEVRLNGGEMLRLTCYFIDFSYKYILFSVSFQNFYAVSLHASVGFQIACSQSSEMLKNHP